jgi:hypothetical protein
MKLKDLRTIANTLQSLNDFASSNSDADESGIAEEMREQYSEAMRLIDEEKYKIYLRNAKAKIKRECK